MKTPVLPLLTHLKSHHFTHPVKIVSGKRRHHGYHTSASDGHQSATPVAAGTHTLLIDITHPLDLNALLIYSQHTLLIDTHSSNTPS